MRVAEVFRSIQGEGLNAGLPMTFVRLQGCTVGCLWCDTKYSWAKEGGEEMNLNAIIEKCEDEWVCITGGEPAQCEPGGLIGKLQEAGKKVCLETSGVGDFASVAGANYITLSPKAHAEIKDHRFFSHADEIKVVVCNASDIDRASNYQTQGLGPILLQPVAGSNSALKLVLDAAMQSGFRVSLQLHKFLGLR